MTNPSDQIILSQVTKTIGTAREIPHKERTTRLVALILVWTFGISFGAHYGLCFWLALHEKTEAIKSLKEIFSIWFPSISALTGTAVAHYFKSTR